MNEQFEKLIAEAFFDESADVPSDKIYTLNDPLMQKFAELIVRECGNIAFEHWALTHDTSPQEVILRHFGIK
jgi:hypothetical protein